MADYSPGNRAFRKLTASALRVDAQRLLINVINNTTAAFKTFVGPYAWRAKQPDLYLKPGDMPLPTVVLEAAPTGSLVKLREEASKQRLLSLCPSAYSQLSS